MMPYGSSRCPRPVTLIRTVNPAIPTQGDGFAAASASNPVYILLRASRCSIES
jgi:hypothetical protein